MSPDRLDECLSIIRWSPDTLARCFGCDVALKAALSPEEWERIALGRAWTMPVQAVTER